MNKILGIFVACCLLLISANKTWSLGPSYIDKDILQSTTWTVENSPYVISNDVTVATGALLTINPGVEVRFAALTNGKASKGPNLIVRGALRAVGDVKSPISFVPTIPKNLWGSIYFYNCDSARSILQSCRIVGGRIATTGSSPRIVSCAIARGKRGIEVAANSSPQILGNRIVGNDYGIILTTETSSPIIQQNEITGNNYGIFFQNFDRPSIIRNKIHSNLKYNLVNYTPKNLDVSSNDFNTQDPALIAKGIYDGSKNTALGSLAFVAGQTAPTTAVSQPQTGQDSTQTKSADGFVPEFAINLGLTGNMLLTSTTNPIYGQTSLAGIGGALFADFRPISWIAVGLGGTATFYPSTTSFTLSTFDIGGRLFPFGSSKSGEFYLLGGLGVNLATQVTDNKFPGFYHGFAGLGYRFAMDRNNGLELGVEYDYLTDHRDPTTGLTLKAGWTFLIK